MGQYYMISLEKEGKRTVYDRSVDGEYMLAKLMEHSWWLNDCCNAISKLIYKNPAKVAWVGDYSDDVDCTGVKCEFYDEVWGDDVLICGLKKPNGFTLNNKFLVNHTKKQAIDCNFYKNKVEAAIHNSENKGWIPHPLPLLTAVGNDLGGGDFHKNNAGYENVGRWYNDEISIEDEMPAGYEKEDIYFYENW